MRKFALVKLAVGCLVLHVGGLQAVQAAAVPLKTELQKAGYALGLSLGKSLKTSNLSPDPDSIGRAAKAQFSGTASLMTPDEIRAVLVALPAGPTNLPPGEKRFKNVKEEIGYAIGTDFSQRMKASGLGAQDLDLDELAAGVKDSLTGAAALLTADEARAALIALQSKAEAKEIAQLKAQDPKFKADSEKNEAEGTAFLAKNKSAPGVKSLTNGLQYSVIASGTGPTPKPTDTVRVNYRGMFLDGTQFDASPADKPFPCSLAGGVIPGWIEILKLMPVGSKWKVFIPSKLAYGERGFPPRIPPNAVLIFEMELVSIDPPIATPR